MYKIYLINMEQVRWLDDLFEPSHAETVVGRQQEFIKLFRELGNKLYVLTGTEETQAIPDMIVIVEFMEKLSNDDNLMKCLKVVPDLVLFLMDTFFPELAALIFRTTLFPNESVLGYTARFLELYIVLSIRAFKGAFPFNMRAVELILNPDRSNYYIGNNAKC